MLRRPALLKATAGTTPGSYPPGRQPRPHALEPAPPRTCQPLRAEKPSRRPARSTHPSGSDRSTNHKPLPSLIGCVVRRPGAHPNKSACYWPHRSQWSAALRPGGGGCVFPEDVAARAQAASPRLFSGVGFAAWAPRHRGPRRRRHDLPHGYSE